MERGERERRKTDVRNFSLLPLACALTVDQTLNLLVYGTTCQPAETHGQGYIYFCINTPYVERDTLNNWVVYLWGWQVWNCRAGWTREILFQSWVWNKTAGRIPSSTGDLSLSLKRGLSRKAFSWLDEADPPYGGYSALLNVYWFKG